MRLFYTGNSPYARRARIAARTDGLAVEEIDVAPLAVEDHALLRQGPGAKVPGLQTDSGGYLCETLIITRYLNDQAGGRLMPDDPAAMEAALELEGIGSLLMDSLFLRAHENRREPGEQSTALKDKERQRAERCYDALDSRLTGQPAVINLATIAALAALGYADWRHAGDEWRVGREGLAAWFDEMMKYPSVAETYPVF
ncbi:MAG: glutathione S-transferase family protein [Alphaproteobacteria bacterium]|nr:glutathione S-transferase family protein [Alphaproteobacteria bacterium]